METGFLHSLSPKQLDIVTGHLEKRVNARSEKSGFGIVYDVTYWCDMKCLGCAVNAHAYSGSGCVPPEQLETSTQEVLCILDKIGDYLSARPGLKFFLNFGGGEPFLRGDFVEIVKEASRRFGKESVGFDTNGTLVTREQLREIGPLVSYIGISLDGLEAYHNWWRRGNVARGITNPFRETVETIKAALEISEVRDSLEVSSVVTKRNLDDLPALMRYLNGLGIDFYSVHRAMPVGRFASHMDLLPSPEDYLRLLVEVTEVGRALGMKVHIHHTVESIYATLLLHHDTYVGAKLGAPDKRSSIGIDPRGNVFFDPWCMVPPWNQLAGGSLLDGGTTLESVFEQEILAIAQEYCRPETRCQGCERHCSGGSRIAAAASYIRLDPSLRPSDVTLNHILAGMVERDPVCPLAQ